MRMRWMIRLKKRSKSVCPLLAGARLVVRPARVRRGGRERVCVCVFKTKASDKNEISQEVCRGRTKCVCVCARASA